jgi:hypothetical protein
MAVGSKRRTTDYRTRKIEKMPRVLREPPFDRLRVVRELEPQDPDRSTQRLSTGGNRGAKPQRAPSFEKPKEAFKNITAEAQSIHTTE